MEDCCISSSVDAKKILWSKLNGANFRIIINVGNIRKNLITYSLYQLLKTKIERGVEVIVYSNTSVEIYDNIVHNKHDSEKGYIIIDSTVVFTNRKMSEKYYSFKGSIPEYTGIDIHTNSEHLSNALCSFKDYKDDIFYIKHEEDEALVNKYILKAENDIIIVIPRLNKKTKNLFNIISSWVTITIIIMHYKDQEQISNFDIKNGSLYLYEGNKILNDCYIIIDSKIVLLDYIKSPKIFTNKEEFFIKYTKELIEESTLFKNKRYNCFCF
jgi:hypothetical protein